MDTLKGSLAKQCFRSGRQHLGALGRQRLDV